MNRKKRRRHLMRNFNGKVAFVTGGGSGAGFGQAQILSEAGCKVVLADIRQDHLDQAMAYFKQNGADVHAIKMDITNREDYQKAADQVETWYGTCPDILVMTAGVNAFGPAEASTFEDFDWIINVNLFGVINGFVTFVPRMLRAGKKGHIAVTGSLGGLSGGPTTAPYSASKAAVINLCESYYEALKPYGIGVTCFCPGNMNTNIHEATMTRPAHLMNTGYYESSESIEMYRRHNILGMDIREVGERLKRAIEDEIVICIPYNDPAKMCADILQDTIDYCTVEGMHRKEERDISGDKNNSQDEAELKSLRDAREAGFATAKKELSWVDKSKKL